jgi:hypothetical protein
VDYACSMNKSDTGLPAGQTVCTPDWCNVRFRGARLNTRPFFSAPGRAHLLGKIRELVIVHEELPVAESIK